MSDELSDAWQCQSCGCYFPHIPKILDNDVKRCSKCVQVEVLEQRVVGLEEKNRVAIKIIQLARSVAPIPVWVGKLEAHLAAEEEATKPCEATIFHGPGHQSKTKCQKEQPHIVHSARYGSMEQHAEWVGDVAHSDFFDAPPDLAGGEEA